MLSVLWVNVGFHVDDVVRSSLPCPLLVLYLNVFDIDFARFCRSFGAFACTFASVAFAAFVFVAFAFAGCASVFAAAFAASAFAFVDFAFASAFDRPSSACVFLPPCPVFVLCLILMLQVFAILEVVVEEMRFD